MMKMMMVRADESKVALSSLRWRVTQREMLEFISYLIRLAEKRAKLVSKSTSNQNL